MIIRQAKPEDAQDLKTLYFDFLTQFPPKEDPRDSVARQKNAIMIEGILWQIRKSPRSMLVVCELVGYRSATQ